ncbi:hypothetical protein AK812_SmicGene794 [Symbiodinium microadriaticum]|uniref:Uncharacterized protein n=1 Tax=Symbiodinium microadriaticum TaxID=2951 RepID=A0A1Q9F5R3_SYMMI|nr:hypothetical protein AK812_SmicGene794 [Symbiodinium microadriaticum]
MAAPSSTGRAAPAPRKEYEYLELTEDQKDWISEQISGWTRKEWCEWYLTLSHEDQEWWERAAASHPNLFEQPTAPDADAPSSAGPGLAVDSVGVEESIGFGGHQTGADAARPSDFVWPGVDSVAVPPQMAEPVPFFQADAAEEEAVKAAQAALEAAMRASEEAARKAAEEAAKKAAILAAEQAAILAAEEAAKKAAEEAARKAAEDAALRAAASSPGVPEAVALPWPNLPMTTAKGGPPQRPAGARPVAIPWKSSPQKRQAETQDVFAMHQVNRPPPVPAKKQKTSPGAASSTDEPGTASGALSSAEEKFEDFDRLEHLATTFAKDPTFKSRLEDHMGYMGRHGQDPQYNY